MDSTPRPGMSVRKPATRVSAFCVGQAKSGTASLCGMLSTSHRAAHEAEREALLEMILRESRHEVTAPDFREFLLERDARLDLEYDISWANQFAIGYLLAVFPAAKFIVLIRDCSSWLESLIGHLVSRDVPPDVRAFLRWWFQPARYPHSPSGSCPRSAGALLDRGIPAWLEPARQSGQPGNPWSRDDVVDADPGQGDGQGQEHGEEDGVETRSRGGERWNSPAVDPLSRPGPPPPPHRARARSAGSPGSPTWDHPHSCGPRSTWAP